MVEKVVGPGDNNVSVAVGDVVVVRLAELGAAGYLWRISSIDPPLLTVESSTVVLRGEAPGASGTREFRLRADTPGQARVEFELSQPWETVPEERHHLAVTVT